MPIPLVALAAGGYILTKGKILKGGGKKLINVSTGPLNDAVMGLGVGTLANVADKKLLQGKLTAYNIPLGAQSINGKPLGLNGTDALTYMVINGIKVPTKAKIISTLITLGVKKYFEAYDYIDPHTPLPSTDSNATNVTMARQQEMQMLPNFSGGLTHS